MTAGQATCVQSANMGQRATQPRVSVCTSPCCEDHQGQRELWLLRRGQSQGNPRSVSTWASSVGSGRPFLAAIWLQGSLSPASSPSLSHCPFLSISSTADSPDPQSTAEFLRVSSSSTPTLTLSSLLSSLRQEPSKDYLGSLSHDLPLYPSICCTLPTHPPSAGLPSSASSFPLFSIYLTPSLISSFHSFLPSSPLLRTSREWKTTVLRELPQLQMPESRCKNVFADMRWHLGRA